MATVDGQQINIEKMEKNKYDDQTLYLTNGLIFRCKYDVCSNQTISSMYAPTGELLSSLPSSSPGNFVREELEKMEALLDSHEAIEDIRDRALSNVGVNTSDANKAEFAEQAWN
ncbi:hypothetical protein ACO0LB_14555 [Undibacterium sp. SXout7W]|uniref:hypothetical protein n=1 Tax=Undibacterium sp. SXout7W TaxID=3413049 RepID=UPI003BF1CD11